MNQFIRVFKKSRLKLLSVWLFCLMVLLPLGLNPLFGQSDGLPRGCYQMPYTRYESENATRGGGAAFYEALDFDQAKTASEASNQQYVGLPSNGSYVQWTVNQAARGVTLRFTMPDDEATGLGRNGSLDVYVNNVKVKTINLTSYYAYQYFNTGVDKCEQIKAGTTKTLMRFDEMHFLLDNALKAGDVLKIQKGNGDALEYGVDFVEIEPVPAAKAAPANSLSVVDYGANGNDQVDDLAAFHSCLAAAKAAGKNVYIPAGKFYLSAKLNFNVQNMIFQGAGIWHTELYFSTDLQFSGGIYARCSNVVISDFFLHTLNNDRWNYNEPFPLGSIGEYKTYKGFMGTYGSNSTISNVWVEHFECGAWVAGYDAPLPVDITDHLTMTAMRIRNNYADGVNFCQGTNNSVVEHSNIRNSGDDGLAVWPNNAVGVNVPGSNNIFRYNTIENQWRAGGTALFGASGHQIHHSIYKDGIASSAIRLTTDFSGYKFDINTGIRIYENTIIRFGTSKDLWNGERGALEFNATGGSISNVTCENIDIKESQRHAVQIGSGGGYNNVVFNNINVDKTGLDPFTTSMFTIPISGCAVLAYASSGKVTFNNLAYSNVENNPAVYNANAGFTVELKTVGNITVTGVSLPTGPINMVVGQSIDLAPAITPDNATNKAVTWTSTNPGVASVDPNTQKLTALTTGSTVITVKTVDQNKTANVTVNVNAAVNITANDDQADESGNTGQFTIAISNTTSDISVKYAISGSAASTDYSSNPALSGTIVLTAAAPSKTITITPINDTDFEGSENLTLTLQAGTGYNLGGNTAASITIADNDNPPCAAPNIALTGTAPVIDQTIDGVWNDFSAVALNKVTIGSKPADFAGSYKAMFDNNNLYLLVQTTDNSKNNDSGTEWWNDDVINIFIDGNNSKGTAYDGLNDFQLGFRYNDNTIHLGGNSVQKTTGIEFNIYATATGYNLEVAIPWATIGVTPVVGKQIGIDVEIDDDDAGGTRDAQMAAFASTEMAWSNPSLFGSVYLTSCAVNCPVTAITVNPTTLSLVKGATSLLTSTVTTTGTGCNNTVTWSSSNTAVATVTSGGVVTAVSAGSATITATSNADATKKATCAVTVTCPAITSVTLNQTTANFAAPGGTVQLSASVAPSTACNLSVNWTTSNAAVATVDATGKVTTIASGNATITATSASDASKSASCAVTVTPCAAVTGVTLSASTLTITKGGSSGLAATVAPANACNKIVTWSSSSKAIATVDANGVVSGVAVGSATITVRTNDGAKTATCAVTVNEMTRGCNLPYTRYESEAATKGGAAIIMGPAYDTKKIESEASDRKYVSLPSSGSYVQWTVIGANQNGFNLRYTLPDNTTGTLALYVNGSKVRDISLTSKWAYQYFDISPSTTGVPANSPGGSTWEARMHFDELHFMLTTAVKAGDIIKLQKDNSDGVTYGVDFIELETVPAAITKPTGFLNIMDYGATPNDETNDQAAFRTCLDLCASNSSYLGVYIPAGRFINSQGGSTTGNLYVANSNITIQGAGMWYSEIYFGSTNTGSAGFLFNANKIKVQDFYINSATDGRIAGNKAFNGSLGSGSTITNVWAEHFETGFWITSMQSNGWNITDGLVISNCRIRNVYADGCNLAKGTSNTTVDNCSFRNCIDDAMATWSVNYLESVPPTACHGNIFKNNTVENNLRAGGLGFFGGYGHSASNLLIKDGLGAGIRANTQFPAYPFGTSSAQAINIQDVTIIGCGTTKNLWTYRDGAIDLELPTPTQGNGYSLQYINFTNIDVLSSQHDAIFIHSYMPSENAFVLDNITFTNVNIDGTGVAKTENNGPQYFGTTGEKGGYGIYAANYSSANKFDGWVSFAGTFKNIATKDTGYFKSQPNFEIRMASNVKVTGVTVAPTSLSLAIGTTSQLTATVAPSNASNKNVTWTSSNNAVATVSSSGVVTAVGSGSATITVTTVDGGFTANCSVPVTCPAITGVTLNQTTASLNGAGATVQLSASIAPATACNTSVTWSTSDATKVTVSSTGLVTAVASGTATITATSNGDNTKKATCAVTIAVCNPVSSVIVTPTSVSIVKGSTSQVTATVLPSDACNKDVTWSSSNIAVATVSSTGILTGLSAGSATLTATSVSDNTKKATCTVTVTCPAITGVTMSSASATLTTAGQTLQLSATVAPANACDASVIWSSSNTAFATVSTSGLVTAVANGTATITAKSNTDNTKTATCAVTVSIASRSPYTGTPIAIPGTIEAENFDKGGEGIAYHDNETANQGGQYRTTEGVDIEVCGEGGYNIGWTNAGEWYEYSINVAAAGNYNIDCRIASGVGGSFSISVGGVDKTGSISVPNTGAWQTWQTVSKTNVALSAGNQILRITSNGGFNINKVTFSPVGAITKYQIKNRWQNTYLYDAGDRVRYSASATDATYQWIFEDVAGVKEIKNVSTGEYMHIENLLGYVQSTTRTSGWMSSRWTLEDAGSGYVRFKNVWQPSYYIHVENLQSQAQYGTIDASWMSAQWQLVALAAGQSAKVETSIADNKLEINYMPNPVVDMLKIELNGNSYNSVRVYDLSGRLEYSGNINSDESSLSIDFANRKNGMYVIRLIGENNIETFKVVKK